MKFIFQLLTLIALTTIGQMMGPWWFLGIASAIAGMVLFNNGFRAFFIGFLGNALVWFVLSYYIDVQSEQILSTRISEMLGGLPVWYLQIAGALLAGLCGGMASLTGTLLKRTTIRNKSAKGLYKS